MTYTDGLIIRCLDCGALNIILSTYELGDRKKCLSCGSLVYINSDSFIYKQSPGVIP
jgi:ribosomal protein S27E